MDRDEINRIVQNEQDSALAFYDESRQAMVSIPKESHSGYGTVACYIWRNPEAVDSYGWEEYKEVPEWVDEKMGRPRYPLPMEPDISLDEIHAFEGMIHEDKA